MNPTPNKRRAAFRSAWVMTRDELVGSNLKLVISIMLAVCASILSYKVRAQLGRANPGDEFIPLLVGPVAFFAVLLGLWLFNWCFRAPYRGWDQAENHVRELQELLQPRFSVPIVQGQQPQSILYGHTSTSLSGKKQTVVQRTNDLLCFPVINETARTLRGCEAYLSRFEALDDREPQFWQSLRLAWLPVETESSTVDIPSQGQRTLVLFRVIGNRVQLVTNEVPMKMVHFIEDKGEYGGLVTLTGEDGVATHVAFQLTCDAPDNPPRLTIMRRGIAESDEGFGWARECPTIF